MFVLSPRSEDSGHFVPIASNPVLSFCLFKTRGTARRKASLMNSKYILNPPLMLALRCRTLRAGLAVLQVTSQLGQGGHKRAMPRLVSATVMRSHSSSTIRWCCSRGVSRTVGRLEYFYGAIGCVNAFSAASQQPLWLPLTKSTLLLVQRNFGRSLCGILCV